MLEHVAEPVADANHPAAAAYGYGMGWWDTGFTDGTRMVSHYGDIDGFLIKLNSAETSDRIAFVKNKFSHGHEALQYGALECGSALARMRLSDRRRAKEERRKAEEERRRAEEEEKQRRDAEEKARLEAEEQKLPVTVCLVDIDDFKRINDRFGHEAGDRALIEIGRRIQNAVRRSDTVARLGVTMDLPASSAASTPVVSSASAC